MYHSLFSLTFGLLLLVAPLLGATPAQKAGDREVQNLRAFAKLYGYVRYFHPSDEASRIDWDKFAVYGAGLVKDARDREELKQTLKSLFLPIAPTIRIYVSGQDPGPPIKKPVDTSTLKKVAWQHRGVGNDNHYPYISFRTNRITHTYSLGRNFGGIVQRVAATPYLGREFKLKASVRSEVRGERNRAQLWLRVDRKNGQRGFFNNMGERPITSPEWANYQISGRIDDDAAHIVFGGFLMGAGKTWLDSFELLVKNEQGEWEPVALTNPGFEQSIDHPQGWGAETPGYRFRVLAGGAPEGKNVLLIERIKTTISEPLFTATPEIGEIAHKELGSGLACHIPLALYSDENGTIGSNSLYPNEPLLKRLKSLDLSTLTGNNESLRLANVVIAWNIFQHFYPYFDVVKVDWDRVLTHTLREVIADKDEYGFYQTMKKFLAQLRDGHASIHHDKTGATQGRLPFLVDLIEKRLVITYSQDDRFHRGDILVAVDGIKAEQVLSESQKFISGSPQWQRRTALQYLCKGRKGSPVKIKIERDNKVHDMEVVRGRMNFLREDRGKLIKMLKDGIYYVNLTVVNMQAINQEIDALANARGIIFDLRGYPRGNHQVIRHLLDEPVFSPKWNIPQIIYPDQENIAGYYTEGRWYMEPKVPRFKGKIVFLTNSEAISYAESFMGIIEHYRLGEIVGQPTAGANGNVNHFYLPGGYRVNWTGMKVLKHDDSQHHLIGIQPTVPLELTIQAVREGRDEYMEKALELISKPGN